LENRRTTGGELGFSMSSSSVVITSLKQGHIVKVSDYVLRKYFIDEASERVIRSDIPHRLHVV